MTGTKINDLSQTIGNMTVQDYNSDRKKLQDQAAAYHGDDITNIAVGGANNNGTISLNRVGQYNDQTGEYETTAPVPGTITVTSTGGEGKDVAIQFSNDQGSFTVDAGSKVIANNGAGGTDLETISVNGQTFNVIGGAISGQIDSKGNVKIQQGNKAPVTIGKVSDWNVKSGQINGSTLTLTTENAYDGNPKTKTVTIEGVASTNYVDGKDALNVKYDSTDKTSITLGGKDGAKTQIHNVANGTTTYDAVNFSQLEAVKNAENYVTEGRIDNASGIITLKRVQGGDVTIEGLGQYVAELNGTELTINRHLGEPIKVNLSQLTGGLSSSDYQVVANPAEDSDGVYNVSADGTLKLTVKDLNNPEAEAKEVSISGIAQKGYVDEKIDNQYTTVTSEYKTYVDGKDALNVKYDSADKTLVTLGGKGSDPVKLTNVADGTIEKDSKDAVNAGQLYDVNQKVDAGWTAKDSKGNTIAVNPTETGTTTLNFAGDKNINVTADKASSTINVELNPNLEVTSVTATGSVSAGGTTISSTGLTAGDVKVNAENATVTGLSNTTWDTEIASAVEANKNGEAGYAATQGQLQKVSEAANEGWTAYINGFETEVKDIHPGNDYFSFNEGDNISITKSEDGNGIVISSDLTNLDVDDTNAVIYDGSVTTNG